MADEPEQIIIGDTAISALEQPRRFFRRRKDRQSPPPTHCENCGAQLHGHYCAQCGQAAIDYRRSFRHVIVDVLDSFLNWDSKFFATLGLLISRPWRLTNEFISGRRVRYVHPLRLYLLASIVFFFVVNYWARAIPAEPGQLSPKDRAEIAADLEKENLPPEVRARIEEALQSASPAPSPSGPTSPNATPVKKEPSRLLEFTSGEKAATPFERWIESRAKEKMGEHGSKMALFIRALISNLPYMMLFCIPLFAFVLKILYIFRRIFYIDHLVYALHIHSFAYSGIMLIVLASLGLNRIAPGAGGLIALLWIVFALQILLSIRRVYRQGWLVSVFKFFLGGFAYLIVLCVAFAATFFVTLALP